MDYMAWNDAIGARFFNPDRSGVRVFLYVTTEVVTEVGASHDAGLNDFVTAVKAGPTWITRHGRGICQQALQALENWRARGLKHPPYLAYLALFVLADTIEVEGFARYSYYPGLRQLLGEEPAAGGYPSFDKMYELWFDLEQWSNEDTGGAYGLFRADILGKREYVGLPKAQTILTDDERHKLPLLFAENGFDPSSPPSDRELSHLLSREAHHYLLPRTKQLLGNRGDGEGAVREVLLDAILEELHNWDGTVIPHAEAGVETETAVGNLRLAMTLDSTARTVRFCLRCRSNREYPDEGLQLSGGTIREPLYCSEDWQGWSLPLSSAEAQASAFDASRLDWREGLSLVDREHAWKTTLSKRSIRVMVSAIPFGFDGFVEQSQLPQSNAFYLLSREDHAEALHAWGRECCKGFFEIAITTGLPHRWRLYSVERANSDNIISDAFPYLAFPTVLRIQFLGGLRMKGNQYFTFALPRIEVTGAAEGANVFCNDHPLDRDPGTGLYTIPDALCARRLVVEIRRENDCIRRRSLYALETVAWRDAGVSTGLDKFGRCTGGDSAEICVGSIVQGVTPPEFNSRIFLPPSTGHRVYFIGRNPGEIVNCPDEEIPCDWRPVWAIPMQKGGVGTAVYCGTDPSNETPRTTGGREQKRRRLWQEILWHNRKKIGFPSHPTLRALWRKYREVAQHVR